MNVFDSYNWEIYALTTLRVYLGARRDYLHIWIRASAVASRHGAREWGGSEHTYYSHTSHLFPFTKISSSLWHLFLRNERWGCAKV